MSFASLVVEPIGQRRARTEDEGHGLYERMVQFSRGLEQRGLLTMTQSLRDDATAVRLSLRGGEASMKDGPFTESKEMIGGFFLLTCQTREEAIAIARECPAAEWATIEVRELGPCLT